ncbi:MAG: Asp23/Gls24 family envelope stress response protein [Clostridiales bacterium]|jgi:uncharacterized alkaline shock family protein YloU|nr:Asp23/Gls24 family envelope stress response protein [Clostridiales bacterium]
MIKTESRLGTIEISQAYFSKLIGNAVSSCFGVAGMASSNALQGLRSIFKKDKCFPDQGVSVYRVDGGINVDLHIIVSYGININAIVDSIVNKARYTVTQATGLEVSKVNVFVDAIKND